MINDASLVATNVTIKLSSTSSNLKTKLINDLPQEVKMTSKDNYTHSLTCIETSNEMYYYGLTVKSSMLIKNEDISFEPICRSYHKLSESLSSLNLKNLVALDVGSSPGGWTEYLLSQNVEKVISVDPGNMSEKLDEKRYTHLKMKFEESLPQIKSALGENKIDILVCDANVNPHQTFVFLKTALQLLNEECIINLTLKLTNGKENLEEFKEEVRGLGFEDLEICWLFSNGRKERNLLIKR